MNENNLLEDTNKHENIKKNFIEIARYETGREKLLGALIYWNNTH